MDIDIGISSSARSDIAEGLSRLLADTYTLYLKTHNYHWNVTGPMFQTLHLMFETQYNELALAVDLIAERIRALGFPAPGTYAEYARLSSIAETPGVPKATEMVRELVAGQEAVVRTARSLFPRLEEAHDEASADLLTQRIQLHEKTAWMLRSLLERGWFRSPVLFGRGVGVEGAWSTCAKGASALSPSPSPQKHGRGERSEARAVP